VGYFFTEKQKVVLFPKYRENGWESAASAQSTPIRLPKMVPFLMFRENIIKKHQKPPSNRYPKIGVFGWEATVASQPIILIK